MHYRAIAISGDIGTGKTTLAKKLAEKLGWEYLSGGAHIRKWYADHNINFSQINAVPEQVDRDLEEDFKKKIRRKKNIIFESRMAGFLAKDFPETLKVLIITDFDVASKRVAARENKELEVVKEEMKSRAEGLRLKFKRLYGVDDFLDKKYFNVVIDTTTNSSEQALELVLEKINH